MINYIKEVNREVDVFYNNEVMHYNGYETILSILCKKHLVKYDYYKKRIYELFKIKKNAPIFLSSNLLLIKLSLSDIDYYINYQAILYSGISKGKVMIIFNNGEFLSLNIGENIMKESYKRASIILDYFTYLKTKYYN